MNWKNNISTTCTSNCKMKCIVFHIDSKSFWFWLKCGKFLHFKKKSHSTSLCLERQGWGRRLFQRILGRTHPSLYWYSWSASPSVAPGSGTLRSDVVTPAEQREITCLACVYKDTEIWCCDTCRTERKINWTVLRYNKLRTDSQLTRSIFICLQT